MLIWEIIEILLLWKQKFKDNSVSHLLWRNFLLLNADVSNSGIRSHQHRTAAKPVECINQLGSQPSYTASNPSENGEWIRWSCTRKIGTGVGAGAAAMLAVTGDGPAAG